MLMRFIIFLSLFFSFANPGFAGDLTTQRYFYDSMGNNAGSSLTNNSTGQTFYYNQQGSPAGSSLLGGPGQTFFYDTNGNTAGSIQTPIFGDD